MEEEPSLLSTILEMLDYLFIQDGLFSADSDKTVTVFPSVLRATRNQSRTTMRYCNERVIGVYTSFSSSYASNLPQNESYFFWN